MTQQTVMSVNPDIIASFKALRRAAKRALELGIKTGTPVYVIRDGRIVDIAREHRGRIRKAGGVSRRPKTGA